MLSLKDKDIDSEESLIEVINLLNTLNSCTISGDKNNSMNEIANLKTEAKNLLNELNYKTKGSCDKSLIFPYDREHFFEEQSLKERLIELKKKIDAIMAKYTAKSKELSDELRDIDFELAGKKYHGWFSPSTKYNKEDQPVSFSVVLNDVFFGHLSLYKRKGLCSEKRPDNLVAAAGTAIEAVMVSKIII